MATRRLTSNIAERETIDYLMDKIEKSFQRGETNTENYRKPIM